MNDTETLNKALGFIVESQRDNDYICEELHRFPNEHKTCEQECVGLNRRCVTRFLRHYTVGKHTENQ